MSDWIWPLDMKDQQSYWIRVFGQYFSMQYKHGEIPIKFDKYLILLISDQSCNSNKKFFKVDVKQDKAVLWKGWIGFFCCPLLLSSKLNLTYFWDNVSHNEINSVSREACQIASTTRNFSFVFILEILFVQPEKLMLPFKSCTWWKDFSEKVCLCIVCGWSWSIQKRVENRLRKKLNEPHRPNKKWETLALSMIWLLSGSWNDVH